jgi:transcriptional regulator with XRE-family HTH domain
MERQTIARILRALRRRRRLSQRALGARLGISQTELSRRERRELGSCSVDALDGWAAALGAHLVIELRLDGERPLRDERHARLQNWLVGWLAGNGWIVEAEVSFNHYGDRGRIDVLAYYPAARVLLVVEAKSRIEDVQDLIGHLDIKVRMAEMLARERGWEPTRRVPTIAVAEGRTARRRIAAHASLFAAYPLRGRQAMAWLRRPMKPAPRGLLLTVSRHA